MSTTIGRTQNTPPQSPKPSEKRTNSYAAATSSADHTSHPLRRGEKRIHDPNHETDTVEVQASRQRADTMRGFQQAKRPATSVPPSRLGSRGRLGPRLHEDFRSGCCSRRLVAVTPSLPLIVKVKPFVCSANHAPRRFRSRSDDCDSSAHTGMPSASVSNAIRSWSYLPAGSRVLAIVDGLVERLQLAGIVAQCSEHNFGELRTFRPTFRARLRHLGRRPRAPARLLLPPFREATYEALFGSS